MGIGISFRLAVTLPVAFLLLAGSVISSPGRTLALKVVVSRGNIRSGPSTEFPVISSAKRGEVFDIGEREGRWYRIDLGNGRPGWIYETLVAEEIIEGSDDESSKSIEEDLDVLDEELDGLTYELTVKIKAANIRERPSTGSPIIKTASFAETFDLLGGSEGGWYRISLPDGREGYIYPSLVEKKVKKNPILNIYRKLKSLSLDYDRRKAGMIYFQNQGFFPSFIFPNRLADFHLGKKDSRQILVIIFHQVMKDVHTLNTLGEAPKFYLPEADRTFLQFCLITAFAEEDLDEVRIETYVSRLNVLGSIEYHPAGSVSLDRPGYDVFMQTGTDDTAFWKIAEDKIGTDFWFVRSE